MTNWKWRIALSVANLLLALGMSPGFYHGHLARSPNLYFAVHCLDLVPRVVVNLPDRMRCTTAFYLSREVAGCFISSGNTTLYSSYFGGG